MFKLVNHIRTHLRKKVLGAGGQARQNTGGQARHSAGGQVAVILIVIIAIGLIFFAASIDLGLVSQTKTITMKAADSSASSMASLLASYGEQIFRVSLGGQTEKCSSSPSMFWSVLTLVALVALAIFAPELAPYIGQTIAASIATAATISAAMEAASIVITLSIDPGFADMWNRMQMANLSQTGQFVERGIQTGLQSAVTDQVRIPDLYDLDQDGAYGYPNNDPSQPPRDTIARFSLYNTKRYMSLHPSNDSEVKLFLEALHNLVLKDTDNWGLWDPVFYPDVKTHAATANPGHACFFSVNGPNALQIPAECDPCCQRFPNKIDRFGQELVGVEDVPSYCKTSGGQAVTSNTLGDRTTCAGRTPYRVGNNVYDLIYDAAYEDSTNRFFSFLEQLGRDDEHHLYHNAPNNPNWHLAQPQNLNNGNPADQGFFLKDVVGHYINYSNMNLANKDTWVLYREITPTTMPPTYDFISPPAVSPKLYPFLYKMRDFGAQLSTLNYANYQCHWCDSRNVTGACPGDFPPEIGQLTLTIPPTAFQSWCMESQNKHGNGADIGQQDPPLVSDRVAALPDGTKPNGTTTAPIFVPDNQCAILTSQPQGFEKFNLNNYVGGWKPGADRYCSTTSPYAYDCPKSGATSPNVSNPQCGETGAHPANEWPDDMLDDMTYGGFPALFAVESSLFKQRGSATDYKALAKTVSDWYPLVADFIETPCQSDHDCPGSVTKKQRPGRMWVWREELKFMNSSIQQWLHPKPNQEYKNSNTNPCFGPNSAWCIPDKLNNGNECPDVSASEAATFDANNNGVRGDLYDVIQCLKWNASDTLTYPPGHGLLVSASGNYEKFKNCDDALNNRNGLNCAADAPIACLNLPRSLIGNNGQPAPTFNAGNNANGNAYAQCLATTTIAECVTSCDPLPVDPFNPLPAFTTPDANYQRFISPAGDIYQFCQANPGGVMNNVCNTAFVPSGQLSCASNFNECMCSWAGSCMAFGQCQTACATFGANCTNGYFNAVTQAATTAVGSCSDGTYKAFIANSAQEAQAQVEKFKHRIRFLQGRYEEAMSLANDASLQLNDPQFSINNNPADGAVQGILPVAIQKFTDFLDGGTACTQSDPNDPTTLTGCDDSPAERFIQAMKKPAEISQDLPAFAIYVWQDPDPDRNKNFLGLARSGTGNGYWHAVKVETRIPRRCTGDCGAWDWPKTEASESGGEGFLGMSKKLCYRMVNQSGIAKARVIRYDQDKDLAGLVFPGGQKIWESRLSNPAGANTQFPRPDPSGLRQTCASVIDKTMRDWLHDPTDPRSHMGAAFMLNDIPKFDPIPDTHGNDTRTTDDLAYIDCWTRVHEALLSHGIQSQSCAQYYMTSSGFRVRFVPCDNWP